MSGLHCSFCSGRHPDEVRFLVAGPGVFICDDCIAQAAALVDEKKGITGTFAATHKYV